MFKFLPFLLKKRERFKIQSFTFYIPSPPPRSSGYREKQFDKIFYEFINRGYDILNFQTQTSSGDKQSGMWLVFIVQAKNAKSQELNFDDIINDSLKERSLVKDSIDGFYYIDDKVPEND